MNVLHLHVLQTDINEKKSIKNNPKKVNAMNVSAYAHAYIKNNPAKVNAMTVSAYVPAPHLLPQFGEAGLGLVQLVLQFQRLLALLVAARK